MLKPKIQTTSANKCRTGAIRAATGNSPLHRKKNSWITSGFQLNVRVSDERDDRRKKGEREEDGFAFFLRKGKETSRWKISGIKNISDALRAEGEAKGRGWKEERKEGRKG